MRFCGIDGRFDESGNSSCAQRYRSGLLLAPPASVTFAGPLALQCERTTRAERFLDRECAWSIQDRTISERLGM
jgi:hypothetical protein